MSSLITGQDRIGSDRINLNKFWINFSIFKLLQLSETQKSELDDTESCTTPKSYCNKKM